MFEFLKKRLFQRMIGYVDVIKIVVYAKLWPKFAEQHGEERGKQISAAVVNLLFGSATSSMHTSIPATLIDELATDFMQREEDEDLLNGIVMSLRTLMEIETAARNTEAMNRIVDTVQWVKRIMPLPAEAPNPEMMERLAATLQSRYCEQ